ncbi:MAG: DinB family protein [Gemmatirosa sp.]
MWYAASDIIESAVTTVATVTPDLPAPRGAAGARIDVPLRLRASRDRLREVVRSVSSGAWTARPEDGRWTACEILEHLALAEWSVVEFVRGTLLTTPRAIGAAPRVSDAEVLRAASDRSVRLESPERLRPIGRWSRPGVVCASMDAARDAALVLAVRSSEALRARVAPHPQLGLLDGAQWLLFLAGHTDRHAAQLRVLVGARRGAPLAA